MVIVSSICPLELCTTLGQDALRALTSGRSLPHMCAYSGPSSSSFTRV
ncbi:hypothetical protein HMPREF9004_1731 [Schaalia cardiffensis F0333]|uniref:Uncharacterized protein n=1 Tax=Schaalia cardiffensis F0333 TaxID=888050 RepID=N6X250_9ACTO|nr:hypothetical protein HMPREF9004_1731 [Schaalia cardiffensis F0333]